MAELKPMTETLQQMLANGKQQKIDLSKFMQICQQLFDECGSRLASGGGREKEEMMKELFALQQTLDDDMESLSKESGKTSEQLLAYVENPDNFPQEVWQTMQKIWRRVSTLKVKKKSSAKANKPEEERGLSSWPKKPMI